MKEPVFLFVFANSQKDEILELKEELRDIKKRFLSHPKSDDFKFLEHAFTTFDDITYSLRTFKNRVVLFHYGGHADQDDLILESGETKLNEIGRLLSIQENLQLVFLNGCSTNGQVQALLEMNIPNIIATSRPIKDKSARKLADQFYAYITEDHSIAQSFDAAMAYVKGQNLNKDIERYRGIKLKKADKTKSAWGLYNKEDENEKWRISSCLDNYLIGLPPINENIKYPGKPFKALNYFTSEDARIFFGRSKKIKEIFEAVVENDDKPLILLYGNTGVGKSSLINAGLLPRLADSWEVISVRSNHEASCNDLMNKEFLKDTLILFDQVEEMISDQAKKSETAIGFFHDLQAILYRETNKKIKVLLGFRKEYLADFDAYVQRFKLAQYDNPISLEPLNQQDIIEVVNGLNSTTDLKKEYRLTIEDGLADQIAIYLSTDRKSNIAPALQILLTRMWDWDKKNIHEKVFSKNLFGDLKESGVLLGEYLDLQLEEMSKTDWGKSGLAIDILFGFCSEMATAKSLKITHVEEQYVHINLLDEILSELKNSFLLTVPFIPKDKKGEKTPLPSLRLAHDSLAPLVIKNYNESELPGQKASRLLSNASLSDKDDDSNLFNKEQINILDDGKSGMRTWNAKEQALYEKSKGHIKRSNLWKGILLGVLLIVGLIAIISLFRQYQVTQEKNKIQMGNILETSADHVADPTLKHNLLLKSLNTFYNQNTEKKMYQNYRDNFLYDSIYHFSNIGGLGAISPNANYMAISRMNYKLPEVDMYSLINDTVVQSPVTISDFDSKINVLKFMKSGDRVYAGGADRYIHIWNIAGVKKERYRFDKTILHMSDSPDGKYLAIVTIEKDIIYFYDIENNIIRDSFKVNGIISDFDFNHDAELYVNTDKLLYHLSWNGNKLEETATPSNHSESDTFNIDLFKYYNNYKITRLEVSNFLGDKTYLSLTSSNTEWLDAVLIPGSPELYLLTTNGAVLKYNLAPISPEYNTTGNFTPHNADLSIEDGHPAQLIVADNQGVLKGFPDASHYYNLKNSWQYANARIFCSNILKDKVILGDARGSVYNINLANDSLIYKWNFGNEPILEIDVTEDEKIGIIYAQNGRLVSIDLHNNDILIERQVDVPILAIAMKNNEVYAACRDGYLRILDSKTLTVIDSFSLPTSDPEEHIALMNEHNNIMMGIEKDLYFMDSRANVISVESFDSNIVTLDAALFNGQWTGAVGLENGTCLIFDEAGHLYHSVQSKISAGIIVKIEADWLIIMEEYIGSIEIWKIPPPPVFNYKT